MDAIIKNHLKEIINKYNIKERNEDKSLGSSFEVFGIFALTALDYQEGIDTVWSKKTKSISAEPNDGGFDGIHIEELENQEIEVTLFQFTRAVGIGKNKIEKFLSDFEKLFLQGSREELNISGIEGKLNEIQTYVNNGKSINYKIYYVYLGDNSESNNSNLVTYFDNQIEALDLENVSGSVVDKRIFLDLLTGSNRNEDIKVGFIANGATIKDCLLKYKEGEINSYTIAIKGNDLFNAMKSEMKKFGTLKFLYSENIRGYLGLKSGVNKRIKETLEGDEREQKNFYYMNNGVTMISEKVTKRTNSGVVKLTVTNPVIVNGLQTSSILYKVGESGKSLDKVLLKCNIYELSEGFDERAKLVEKITDSTNSQNAIKPIDKISNSEFQVYLEKLFEKDKIKYSRKQNVYPYKDATSFEYEISSEKLIKFWYAINVSPIIAKNSKAKVIKYVQDILSKKVKNSDAKLFISENGEYDALFQKFSEALRIYRYVSGIDKEGKGDYINHINEILSYGYSKFIIGLGEEINTSSLEEHKDTLLGFLETISSNRKKTIENNGEVYSHNTYFKSEKAKDDFDSMITNRIAEKTRSSENVPQNSTQ